MGGEPKASTHGRQNATKFLADRHLPTHRESLFAILVGALHSATL